MMAEMKSDMGGAAAVIEAVIAAAKLKLPIEVTATVPMAENAVSGTAYRPSDVLTHPQRRAPSRWTTPTPRAG